MQLKALSRPGSTRRRNPAGTSTVAASEADDSSSGGGETARTAAVEFGADVGPDPDDGGDDGDGGAAESTPRSREDFGGTLISRLEQVESSEVRWELN